MNEIHIITVSGLDEWFVRFNSAGQVALSNGSSFEVWGANGHTIEDYKVAALEIGTGSGIYVGSFDASGLITVAGTYYLVGYKKVAAVYTKNAQGSIVWDGTKEIDLTTMGDARQATLNYVADKVEEIDGKITNANIFDVGEDVINRHF